MCLFPLLPQRYQSVCAPRGMWIEAGVKWSLRVASRDCSAHCSDDWGERQFRLVLITFGAGADRGRDGHDCKFRAPEMPPALKVVILALFLELVRVRSSVVGGKSGSRDVVYSKSRTVGETTSGLRRARENATRRVTMSSGERHS